MPRISEEELVIVQYRIYKRDKLRLDKFFAGGIGVNNAVRAILRATLDQIEAATANAIDREEDLSKIEITDEDVY